MKNRSVLVTNDDSINSPGLWALVRAVVPLANRMIVVAPTTNQSAVGAGFTLHRELRWERLSDPPVPGVEAWHVGGTPADCVIVGTEKLASSPVDLVLSGVNHGANVGSDVLASGTVGGAVAAYLRGTAALAFSLAVNHDASDADWRMAERVAALVLAACSGDGLAGSLLNVNIPQRSFEHITGMVATRVGRHGYVRLQEMTANTASLERAFDAHTHPDTPPGTDIWALAHGYISVSPLQANLTDHRLIDLLGTRLNTAFRH